MGIWLFAVLASGTLALVHRVLIPRVRRAITAPDATSLQVQAGVGTLAVLQQVRMIACVTLVMTLGVVAAVEGAALAGRALSIAALGQHLQWLRTVSDRLGALRSLTAALLVSGLTIVLVVLARRNARKKFSLLHERERELQMKSLLQQYVDRTLEEIPPTREMQDILAQFERMVGVASSVEADMEQGQLSATDGEATLAKIRDVMDALRGQYAYCDVARRVDVRIDASQVAEPEPVTRAERWRTFFVSRGLVSSLSGATRALYVASLILLLPSSLMLSAGPARATLTSRVASLDQLRVARSAEAAAAEYDESLRELPAASRVATPDSVLLDDVARAFEDASFVMAGRSVGTSVASALTRQRILATAATADPSRTLETVATLADGPGVDANTARVLRDFERTEGMRGPRSGVGRRFREDLRGRLAEQPGLGARLQEMRSSFLRPAATDDVSRLILREAFGEILDGDISLARAGNPVVDALASVVEGDVARAYGVQRDVFMAQIARGASIEEAQAAVQLVDRRYPRWTNVNLQQFDGVVRERVGAAAEVLEHYQPALRQTATLNSETRAAAATLRDMAGPSVGSAGELEQVTEALVSYDDFFPAQYGAETRTARGALLAELDPATFRGTSPGATLSSTEPFFEATDGLGSGGGSDGGVSGGDRTRPGERVPATTSPVDAAKGRSAGAELLRQEADLAENAARRVGRASGAVELRTGAPGVRIDRAPAGAGLPMSLSTRSSSGATRLAAASTRARSFGRLRGFARVGGVLIGRGADDTSRALNFRDLTWRRTGGTVTLSFVTGSGDTVTLPAVRSALAYRALIYAADGRPTAVTMVTATPLADLKILLHPALVDTPLGCETTELDRLVDIYTGGERGSVTSARSEAQEYVYRAHALYQIAWAERANQAAQAPEQVTQLAREILRDDGLDSLASVTVRERQRFTADNTPVIGSTAFYDQVLVREMQECLGSSSGSSDFRVCIGMRTQSDAANDASVSRVLSPPPDFTIWSGVRERGFVLDPRLAFARPDGRPSPLQFMLQVAFTSSAAFGDDETPPWEFPLLGSRIEEAVRAGVSRGGNSQHARVVRDLEEFTRLQRLFRMALGHQLGRDFPLSRLVQLTEELQPYGTARMRTPRWNPKPLRLEAQYVRQANGVAAAILAFADASTALDPAIKEATARFAQFVDNCSRRLSIDFSATQFDRACSLARPDHPVRQALGHARAQSTSVSEEQRDLLDYLSRQIDRNTAVQQARKLRQQLRVQDDERAAAACPPIT